MLRASSGRPPRPSTLCLRLCRLFITGSHDPNTSWLHPPDIPRASVRIVTKLTTTILALLELILIILLPSPSRPNTKFPSSSRTSDSATPSANVSADDLAVNASRIRSLRSSLACDDRLLSCSKSQVRGAQIKNEINQQKDG